MTFNEYQKEARKTAIYPNIGDNLVYPTLGLVGEAGEIAEKIKKIIRDNDGIVSEEKRGEIAKELGDVLWYLSQLANEMGFGLNEIAEINIKKLKSRAERGKLGGSGDNR
jgi:NTP pyrophosphatase (non-canonical NTP hydrolase)